MPSLLGKDYVKQPGWQTFRNPPLPTFGNGISKRVLQKTDHALAVRRLSQIVWNNKSLMQPKKVNESRSRRSQTTSSPKSSTQPSGMYWPRKDTINMLHARCLTLRKSRRLNGFIGRTYTRITRWETGKMLFGLTSAMFTSAMIEGECTLHTAQTKNIMRTVWYRHSSSLLFVLWYGDVLWRGGKVHWLCWNIQEGREVGWTRYVTRSRCWMGFWGISLRKWSQRSLR